MADQTLDESLLTTGVQSPFLPGTKIMFAWDSTCLGLIKSCPRLYQYTIIDGWASRHESVHLRFGAEYHSALEAYDHSRANGVEHEDAIHDVVRATLHRTWDYEIDDTGAVVPGSGAAALPPGDDKAHRYKNRASLIAIVIDYLDHFGADDPAVTYVKADRVPAVELSFRFELDFGPDAKVESRTPDGDMIVSDASRPYLLSGHLDRVVEFNDQLFVMDRKTSTATLSSNYFAQYEPNNQMTLYTIAGKVVLDSPIRGVIIDAAQIMIDSPNRFVRGFTYRTQDQLDEWLLDLELTLQQAEAYATAEYWPMNDTACGNYGGCKFRDICSKSPGVREQFLKGSFTKLPEDKRWNPLKAR